MNIGDIVNWQGKEAKIISKYGNSVIIYVTDSSGGFNYSCDISSLTLVMTASDNIKSIWNKLSVQEIDDALKEEPKSIRLNSGKTSLSEIDPDFILGIGEVLTKSQAKYPAFNWQKQTNFSTILDSLERHVLAFKKGENIDPDDGLSHILKAAVNLMFLNYHLSRNEKQSDDRMFKKDKK